MFSKLKILKKTIWGKFATQMRYFDVHIASVHMYFLYNVSLEINSSYPLGYVIIVESRIVRWRDVSCTI